MRSKANIKGHPLHPMLIPFPVAFFGTLLFDISGMIQQEEGCWRTGLHLEIAETDQMKLVHVKDKRIVLARTGEGWAAFDDRCPNKGGSLAGGSMICGTVQCQGVDHHLMYNPV